MLILSALLVALLLVPLTGGRLGRLSELSLRRPWLLLLGLGLQVLTITVVPTWPRPLLVGLHALSYLLAGAFVWTNRRVPGIGLVALGGILNAVCIAANGGQMPASARAVAAAGLEAGEEGFVNSGVVEDPRLLWLGDVFASPSWLPLSNVYSVGDLLLLAGVVWCVHRTCGTVLARWPAPRLSLSDR